MTYSVWWKPWSPLSVCTVTCLLAGWTLGGCTVGHHVTAVPPGTPVSGQAAYYALPRTVVVVDFPVQRKERKKGTGEEGGQKCFDLLDHRAEFLPAGNKLFQAIGFLSSPKITAPSFSVSGPPTLSSLPEPDPGEVYRVDLSSSWAKKQAIDLTFGPLGVLKSGVSSVQDQRVDLAIGLVTSILELARFAQAEGAGLPAAGAAADCTLIDAERSCQKAACEIYNARRALDELPGQVTSAALEADQAEWLRIQHEKSIAENLPLFVRQETTKSTIRCASRPPFAGPTATILKFNKADGFATGGAESDCVIPQAFDCTSCTLFADYDLKVTVLPDQYSEFLGGVEVDLQHDVTKPQGFYYRVPAVASLDLMHGRKLAAEQDMVIAQLGIVAALPAQKTYQTKYAVTLDPATGALVKLTADSEVVGAKAITDVGDAVSGFLDSREEEKKARAAAQDELALLERERKLLEEKKKIRDLLEELGEDDAP